VNFQILVPKNSRTATAKYKSSPCAPKTRPGILNNSYRSRAASMFSHTALADIQTVVQFSKMRSQARKKLASCEYLPVLRYDDFRRIRSFVVVVFFLPASKRRQAQYLMKTHKQECKTAPKNHFTHQQLLESS
jgi:hypothetical protein